MQNITRGVALRRLTGMFAIFSFALLLSACGSTPEQDLPPPSLYHFVDTTKYFANRTGSVSMRATFSKVKSNMAEGYKFQFRTVSPTPVFLDSISIIAGGKRIFLEEGQVVLPTQQGLTLSMSLEDSLFVSQFPSALLQFRHNNQSEIFAIELHQLADFVPQ